MDEELVLPAGSGVCGIVEPVGGFLYGKEVGSVRLGLGSVPVCTVAAVVEVLDCLGVVYGLPEVAGVLIVAGRSVVPGVGSLLEAGNLGEGCAGGKDHDGLFVLEVPEIVVAVCLDLDVAAVGNSLGGDCGLDYGVYARLVDTAVVVPLLVFAELEHVVCRQAYVLEDYAAAGLCAHEVGVPIGVQQGADDGPCGTALDRAFVGVGLDYGYVAGCGELVCLCSNDGGAGTDCGNHAGGHGCNCIAGAGPGDLGLVGDVCRLDGSGERYGTAHIKGDRCLVEFYALGKNFGHFWFARYGSHDRKGGYRKQ